MKDFPAFPGGINQVYTDLKLNNPTQSNMTLRDYFAAKALAAMIGLECKDGSKRGKAGVPILAGYAYEYADAMIAARGAE